MRVTYNLHPSLSYVFLACFFTAAFGLPPDTLWTRVYGGPDADRGYAVRQTSDGGYIIVGETCSFGAGWLDLYLIKIDADGDTLWTRTFGGPAWDRGECIEQTSDGGYIIVGFTYSFGAGLSDIYVVKTTAAGDTLWTRTYGSAGWDIGKSVQETVDGAYVIAGHTVSGSSWDVFLMKIDADGDTLWTKTCGGYGMDYGHSVGQTSDNGYIVVGSTDSYGAGLDDVRLLKLESDLGFGESTRTIAGSDLIGATIISGPVPLPGGKKCRLLDITGRIVEEERPACGIYFLEVEGRICEKIVMVK